MAEENNKKAKIVDSLLENQDRLLSSILVGNNLVNIGASSLTTLICDLFVWQ
ncbi:MAG: CNNM domain-containing protein [Coprobacillus cateniformis]